MRKIPNLTNPKYWKQNEVLPAKGSLRDEIRQAIIKRIGEDPKDKFKIENLDIKKREAEIYIKWDRVDSEIIGINY